VGLPRRTPMSRGRGARTKGGSAEREIVEILRAHGWDHARRNFRSGADGGGDVLGIPGVSIEVKRRERCSIWEWLEQCFHDARPTDLPLLVFRRNRSQWYACLPLEELLPLLALRERGL
jgi:hypothetical protein